jgi:diacylglycerol kinase family enzyme
VDRKHPPIRLRWGPNLEHERKDLYLALCQKTKPFTYFGNRELNICPDARLEKGLDCLALDTMRSQTILRLVGEMFTRARHTKHKHVLYLHDEQQIEATSDMPLPLQMDGEYVGERTHVLFESVPDMLSLIY